MSREVLPFRAFARLALGVCVGFAAVFAAATLWLGIPENWLAVFLTLALGGLVFACGRGTTQANVARRATTIAGGLLVYAALVIAFFPAVMWAVFGCVLLAFLLVLPYHKRDQAVRFGVFAFIVGAFSVALYVLDRTGNTWWPTIALPSGYAVFLNAAGMLASMGLSLVLVSQVAGRLRDEVKQSSASGRRFEALFRSSPDAVLQLDADGRIEMANAKACAAFGEEDQIVGRFFPLLLSPRSRPQVMEAMDADGPSRIVRIEGLRGKQLWPGEAAVGSWQDEGARKQIVVVRDVSQLESALARIAADTQRAQFITRLSHELRTPLTAILGAAHLLAEQMPAEEERTKVRAILRSSDHLLGLVNDILDVSRIESANFELLESDVDVRACIEHAIEIGARIAHKKGIGVWYTIDADVPISIRSDPGRLRQVVLNLVANGVRATDAGHVGVRARMDGGQLVVDVQDTGCGIAPHDKMRIFDAFQQVGKGHGTGLGLTIVQAIVAGMGGKIEVSSKLGEGSTFSIRIPAVPGAVRRQWPWTEQPGAIDGVSVHVGLRGPAGEALEDFLVQHGARTARADDAQVVLSPDAPASGAWVCLGAHDGLHVAWPYMQPDVFVAVAKAAGRYRSAGPEAPKVAGESLRILLVEDVAMNRILLAGMLQAQGHRVDTAETGEEAVDAAARRPYDVIFMDINLPKMGGHQATRLVRDLGGPRPWIVGLTAHTGAEVREACIDSGMDGYLAKPCGPDELRGAIAQRALVRA